MTPRLPAGGASTLLKWLPQAIVAADLVLLLAFVVQIRELTIVNNAIDIWFDRSDPTVDTLAEEHRLFGSETWMLATVWLRPDQVDAGALVAETLTRELERINEVTRVVSPTSVPVLQRDPEGSFFDHVAADRGWPALRRQLLEHPVAGEFLVYSRSPAVFCMLIKERTAVSSAGGERMRLVSDIRRVLDEHPAVLKSALSGTTVINAELNRLSWSDFRVLTPVTVALASVVLLALLRFRLRTTLAILVPIGLTMLSVVAAMLMVGRPFTMVTIALPGLILVLGIASSLHVVAWTRHWLRQEPRNTVDVPWATASRLARPIVVSELTTALGFGLLAVIPVTPVQEMALFGAAGVLYSGIHILFVLPKCLWWFGAADELVCASSLFVFEGWAVRRLDSLTSWLQRHRDARPWLVAGLAVACGALVWLMSMVVYDSTYLNMIDPSERLRRDYASLDAAKLPGAQLSVLITRDDRSGLMDATLNTAIRRATAEISALAVVSKIVGPAEVFDEVAPNLAGEQPLAQFGMDDSAVTDAYVFALSSGNTEVGSYVHEGLDAFRLVVLFPYLSNSKLEDLSRQISSILERRVATLPGVSANLSGVTVLWANMDNAISRGQVTSIVCMAAAMFFSFLVSLRSWRLASTSTLVNVLPVVSIGALLGATGRPIDMATVFIMGVALGIADDDTSFTVHECVDRARHGEPGVAATIRHTGPATIAACLVIVLGFSVLLVSSFTPIRTFGALTALGLLLAMFCDVFILPFLLFAFPAALEESADDKTLVSEPGVVGARGGAESP